MQSRKILWLFIGCLFFKFILFDLDWSLNTTFSSFSFPQTYLTKFLLASLLAVPFLYIRSRWYLITVGTLIDLLLIVNLMYFRTYYTSIPWDSYFLVGNLSDFTASVFDSLRWSDLGFPLLTVLFLVLTRKQNLKVTLKEQRRKREIQDALKQLHWQVYESPTSMPEDLCYLEGIYLEDYLHDVEICQAFARRSREKMAEVILERTVMTGSDAFHTIHNYIDTDEMILRKGAIAAHKGEKVLIPINMKDGSILAIGKGNPEWNFSAPHGAGRIMSRTKAKNELNLDEYKKAMEGVYTTSVNENTLDEAPMAYKSLDDIIDVIRESVDVIDVMKPIYNFKASE